MEAVVASIREMSSGLPAAVAGAAGSAMPQHVVEDAAAVAVAGYAESAGLVREVLPAASDIDALDAQWCRRSDPSLPRRQHRRPATYHWLTKHVRELQEELRVLVASLEHSSLSSP